MGEGFRREEKTRTGCPDPRDDFRGKIKQWGGHDNPSHGPHEAAGSACWKGRFQIQCSMTQLLEEGLPACADHLGTPGT